LHNPNNVIDMTAQIHRRKTVAGLISAMIIEHRLWRTASCPNSWAFEKWQVSGA
jgi:hypothetical protein